MFDNKPMHDTDAATPNERAGRALPRRGPRRPFVLAAQRPLPAPAPRGGEFPHNGAMHQPMNDPELIELLDRVAGRDAAAFKRLYDQCAPKLFGLAIRVVDNRSWAEEVLQDAFIVIWRTASEYQASLSPPMAWMGLIVRSRGLDFLRRRASQRTHLTQPIDDDMADGLADDAPSPLDTAQASEQAWALHQCLLQLDNRQREVVSLAYVRDLSHGELAARLRLPLGTVKTWIRRGLEQLRTCMARFA